MTLRNLTRLETAQERDRRILGPLYVWRADRRISGWTIAEQAYTKHRDVLRNGDDTADLARLFYLIEKGRTDPQTNEAYPLWLVIWSMPGGKGLDVEQLRWWQRYGRAG
ncbi:MAG: hypothetical protein IT335_16200 [Thermomicrobiales bacterium]|nr:hypothetical protein [Thermomicrobiales bacterium]